MKSWEFLAGVARLPIDPRLKTMLSGVGVQCTWPQKGDPTAGGKAWTGVFKVQKVADLNGLSRRSVQRPKGMLVELGLFEHFKQPDDKTMHKPWKWVVKVPMLRKLFQLTARDWRESDDPVVRALKDWVPADCREAQGPKAAERGERPSPRSEMAIPTADLEEFVWDLVRRTIPAHLLEECGGYERKVKSVPRNLGGSITEWEANVEIIGKALEVAAMRPNEHTTGLERALAKQRGLWHHDRWPAMLVQARKALELDDVRQALAAVRDVDELVSFTREYTGDMTLEDGRRLLSQHAAFGAFTMDVWGWDTYRPTLHFSCPEEARVFAEHFEALLAQMSVRVSAGDPYSLSPTSAETHVQP